MAETLSLELRSLSPATDTVAPIWRKNVAAAVARLRTLDVQKAPGIAETINWVAALELLGIDLLDDTAVERTLGSVMKYREDLDLVIRRGIRWVATGSD